MIEESLIGLRLDLLRIGVKLMSLDKSGNVSDATRLLVSLLETQTDEQIEALVSAELERTKTQDLLPPATTP